MSPTCSAPVQGHRKPGSAAKCPVHRPARIAPPVVEPERPALSPPRGLYEMRSLAEDPSTSPETLAGLAESGSVGIRFRVAENPSAAHSTLVALSVDSQRLVRGKLARNPALPRELFELLANDRAEGVRQCVAESIFCPLDMLPALMLDIEEEVRSAARRAALTHIQNTLAVDRRNHAAIEALLEQAWWEMEPGDAAVVLSLALYPDA